MRGSERESVNCFVYQNKLKSFHHFSSQRLIVRR